MAYSAITQPDKYMGAYSAVPLKLFDTDYDTSENYKYIINVCWDKVTITGQTTYLSGVNVWTQLSATTPHNLVVGDGIFLNDKLNSNLYTGYYLVKKVISSTSFVIDLTITEPFGANNYTVCKYIKYKLPPDLDGFGKVNFSNLLKDFVNYNLTGETVDYSLTYDGTDTRFDYELVCGAEKIYRQEFIDNVFYTGNTIDGINRVGFNNPSITTLSGTEFRVGDRIKVEQEIYGWPYLDNAFQGFNVGFSGSTAPPFEVGQNVTVTGQITHPTYNGETSVLQINGNQLEIPKIWEGNTPTEPGIIYGTPVPQYNTVGTITTIYIDPILGLVIGTDIPYVKPTPAIGGFLSYADNRTSVIYDELTISGLSVYNAYVDKNDYTLNFYDKYVVQNRAFNLNNLSTILNNQQPYRIEKNSIGFLLLHNGATSQADGLAYEFYDENNNVLGQILITGNTDTYFPLGVDQIGDTGYIDLCRPCTDIALRYQWGASGSPLVEIVLTPQGTWNGRPYYSFLRETPTPTTQFFAWDNTQQAWLIQDGGSVPGVIERAAYYPTFTGDTGCAPFSPIVNNQATPPPFDEWLSVYYNTVETYKIGGVCDNFVNYSGDVKSYCVYAASQNFTGVTQESNKVCFQIDDECSRYEIYHIMWVDQYGSLITMPFKYVSRDNINVERQGYYKKAETWENDTFGYDDYARGRKDFYVKGIDGMTLNSGWLKDFERALIKDMMLSAGVYIQTPDNRIYAGKLVETNVELFKTVNEDLYSYTFNVTMSLNQYRF